MARHSPATLRFLYHAAMQELFDVAIVGGGLVGMSLAAALDGHGRRVLLLDASVHDPLQPAAWDERHFALARASVERLSELDAFPQAAAGHPIRQIHISRAGEFGRVLLDARGHGVDAFGLTVPARLLVGALEQRLARARDIHRLRPAELLDFVAADDAVEIRWQQAGVPAAARARLLVAADGSASSIRARLGIAVERCDYQQTAVVCAATTSEAHQGRAFERFTDSGPLAVLPLGDQRCGVVCTVPATQAEATLALDDGGFIALLQQRFGYRLGRFTRVGRRQAWPLALAVAERVGDRRVALIGNAAQTIHPIGAQGFNLGLRDASALADSVLAATDPGAEASLDAYAASRRADRAQTIAMSDGLVRLTRGVSLPHQVLRGLAMLAADRLPGLQGQLARAGMGYRSLAL
ncbi:MAG: FAD-dependent monooxygenase [Lysobacterales bacterium]